MSTKSQRGTTLCFCPCYCLNTLRTRFSIVYLKNSSIVTISSKKAMSNYKEARHGGSLIGQSYSSNAGDANAESNAKQNL